MLPNLEKILGLWPGGIKTVCVNSLENSYCWRILESQNQLGWEKPSKSPVINPVLPSPQCPQVSHSHVWNTSRDGDPTASLGTLFQCLTTFLVKKLFLLSNINLSWCYLGLFHFVLWPAFWDNSLNSHVSTASCQAVEESKKVPPKPPSLQAEQGEFQ